MLCSKATLLLGSFAIVLVYGATAAAQGKLAVVDFQNPPPYIVTWPDGSRNLLVINKPAPKAPGVLWDFTHHPSGGWNGRAFTRYSWWAWGVSQTGHGAEQAGWTAAGASFRPPGGWLPYGPYYLRFRIRVTAPLIPHPPNNQCDGDTQMKFFIWNAFTGTGLDRVIMMLHAGSQGGGNDTAHTTIDLRAGISASYARTVIPNGEWVHVQLAWRWGPEPDAFQRIYINTNSLEKPTVENRQFNDLDTPAGNDTWGSRTGATGLDNQFFFGDITNTGSCVRNDALLDLMDFELATAFDSKWFPGR